MKSFLNNHKVRGLRNNNPGNLVKTNIAWQGKLLNSKDSNFEQFTNITFGLRAMYRDLINDIDKGSNTIQKLILQYAPPHENDTQAYINSVARDCKIGVNDKISSIDDAFLLTLGRAIIKVELGVAHTEINTDDLRNALKVLGVFSLKNITLNIKNKPVYKNTIIAICAVFFYTFFTLKI